MTGMTIAALAREGGVGVETVRYYQRRGLLDEPDRPTGAGAGGGIRPRRSDDQTGVGSRVDVFLPEGCVPQVARGTTPAAPICST